MKQQNLTVPAGSAMTPGAVQAISYHNQEADAAHRQAMQALDTYNRAMRQLQDALARGDGDAAEVAEAWADTAWKNVQVLLQQGYQHRNSAAIAASMAAEIENDRRKA